MVRSTEGPASMHILRFLVGDGRFVGATPGFVVSRNQRQEEEHVGSYGSGCYTRGSAFGIGSLGGASAQHKPPGHSHSVGTQRGSRTARPYAKGLSAFVRLVFERKRLRQHCASLAVYRGGGGGDDSNHRRLHYQSNHRSIPAARL